MITFYQVFNEYLKHPDAVQFSKKQIKKMHHCIKYKYDALKTGDISYIEQQEGDKIYSVRVYPREFKKTIVGLINRFHKIQTEKFVAELDNCVNGLKEKIRVRGRSVPIMQEQNIERTGPKKVRKRIPVVKPVFSSKPK